MKICFITPYYPPNTKGGMEISISILAEALAKMGHRIYIFTPNYGQKTEVEGQNPKIFRVKWGNDSVFARTNPWAVRKFAKEVDLTKSKFDIVDSYSWFQPGEIISKKRKIPHIVSIRDSTPICDFRIETNPKVLSPYNYFKKRFSHYGFGPRQLINALYGFNLTRANHQSIKEATGVFCASESLARIVKPLNRYTKVVNSIAKSSTMIKDLKINIPGLNPKQDKIVLYAGRLSIGKGAFFLYKTAIEIIKNEKTSNIKFVFAGEGELVKQITNQNPNILLPGKLNHDLLQKVIAVSRVCVVPSIVFEAFPRLAVESLALNTPVIGTDVGGIPEAVGKAGLIIKPNNSNELKHAILKILKDDRTYKVLKKATYSEARKYTAKVICQKIISGYQEAIDEFRHNA